MSQFCLCRISSQVCRVASKGNYRPWPTVFNFFLHFSTMSENRRASTAILPLPQLITEVCGTHSSSFSTRRVYNKYRLDSVRTTNCKDRKFIPLKFFSTRRGIRFTSPVPGPSHARVPLARLVLTGPRPRPPPPTLRRRRRALLSSAD